MAILPSLTRVILNDAGIQKLFNSPDGEVAKNLARRAIRVESQAKTNASGRPGPRVRTGRLRSSIHWELVTETNGVGGTLYARVGSTVSYAIYVEKGSSRAPAYPYLRPALSAAR